MLTPPAHFVNLLLYNIHAHACNVFGIGIGYSSWNVRVHCASVSEYKVYDTFIDKRFVNWPETKTKVERKRKENKATEL